MVHCYAELGCFFSIIRWPSLTIAGDLRSDVAHISSIQTSNYISPALVVTMSSKSATPTNDHDEDVYL